MTATPWLLLPGLLCDATVWASQCAALARLCACRVPDYRAQRSIAAMAELVLEDAPPRFALAGHSMGGRVALEVVRRAPERVARLALLDTGFEPRAAGEAGEREAHNRAALVELAQREGMAALARAWLPGMLHPARRTDGALLGPLLAMIERQRPEQHAAQIEALLARPDATDVLGRIRCPTLVVCGRQDAWSPLERHERMAGAIAGAQLAVLEDCGHMAPVEQPHALNAVLERFAADEAAS